MLTEEEIQVIKESLEASTPGKWEVNDFDMLYSAEIISEYPNGVFHGIARGMYTPNAELIANSPTWLKQLLADRETLQQQLELKESEYQSAIDKVNRSTKIAQEYQQQNKQLIEVLESVSAYIDKGWYATAADKIDEVLQQIQGNERTNGTMCGEWEGKDDER